MQWRKAIHARLRLIEMDSGAIQLATVELNKAAVNQSKLSPAHVELIIRRRHEIQRHLDHMLHSSVYPGQIVE